MISSNKIGDCKGNGICANNGGRTLNAASTDNKITGNIINNTLNDGIYIGTGSTGTVISKNDVGVSNKSGIVVLDSKKCQVISNKVSDCRLDGIYLKNIGDTDIKSNNVTTVKRYGVQVISSQLKSLYGNTITGNGNCGLRICSGKASSIRKNHQKHRKNYRNGSRRQKAYCICCDKIRKQKDRTGQCYFQRKIQCLHSKTEKRNRASVTADR